MMRKRSCDRSSSFGGDGRSCGAFGDFDDDGPGWDEYPQIKAELKPTVADDGIFWLTKQEFFRYYTTVYVCAKDMAEFIQ